MTESAPFHQSATERDACGIGFVADAHGRASHRTVKLALEGLARVVHRGALAADAKTSDGSGVLLPIPESIFGAGVGVASLFVRAEHDIRSDFEKVAHDAGVPVVGWRTPPTDDGQLGEWARASRPRLLQAVLAPPQAGAGADSADGGPDSMGSAGSTGGGVTGGANERAAFALRRHVAASELLRGVYVASCSFRTIVYKALVASPFLGSFYPDLTEEETTASFVVFHQRFSTNTAPTWERAQPMRTLCHNGEINAISGNAAHMAARRVLDTRGAGLGDEGIFHPVLDSATSDSGMLDEAVELLSRAGRDIRHAVAMLVPKAWENDSELPTDVRGFYQYHSCLVEPWDGPAGLVFTDGLGVGAALDRNGLRPLRYAVCEDGLIACCSEAGAIDVAGHGAVRRGRLGPGEMIFVDPTRGFLDDADCEARLGAGAPYARWAADGLARRRAGAPVEETPSPAELVRRQATQGYTLEELRMILRPMAADAKEPTFAMGDDTPLPHLAGRPRPVTHYLRQRFAQVTNPPIDHLRERLVMSLRTLLGPRQPLLSERPEAAHLVELESFFLYPSGVTALVEPGRAPFPAERLDATWSASPDADLESAVDRLCAQAVDAAASGAQLLVVDNSGVGADRAAIPAVIAVGAVNQALVAAGVRPTVALVVVADDVFDSHGIACLLGAGADAICPQLALMTVASEADASTDSDVSSPDAQERYRAALEDGVLKILSKMGISTVDSYRGAALFEAIGLADEVVARCFAEVTSAVGGAGWDALGTDCQARHAGAAWPSEENSKLTNPGFYRDLKRGGDYHIHDKGVVDAMHDLVASKHGENADPDLDSGAAAGERIAAHVLQRALRSGRPELYRLYADMVQDRPPAALRDQLSLVPAGPPIPIEEVEPVSSIVSRFSTGAMSHGSLSAEAHETLAEAMNLLGGRSNCGEGGEAEGRFATRGRARGDKNSRIKQIASGRFGVTPQYAAYADELQIKMAQGSKPGEGGQLPGHKVSEEIARLRHTQAGVTLISPPPHHDIYSIEDLAQLIFDLKQVGPFADVSVKLVSEKGVGTVAAGVVKALADVVQISGADGGTGASPLSSIKHAGMPWELGLAETQTALVTNDLRSRVRVRVDGGFMTGRDVVVAALLGADEFSFGTAAMIAEGCIMLRACHKDTCSVGVATQRPRLRAKFTGTAEGVASFFLLVASEVRSILASLGMRSLDEAIGRVACLSQRSVGSARGDSVDLGVLLGSDSGGSGGSVGSVSSVGSGGADRHYVAGTAQQRPRSDLGDRVMTDAFRSIWDGETFGACYQISNSDRTVGAALGGALALEFGTGTPSGKAELDFIGSAGQSFGAFLTDGIRMSLTGEANDYVGKAMGGGRIAIRPPADDAGAAVLAGNTCLYGATAGELYIAGAVGERFAVRNSGARAVVEGAGDHLCEYMTGGTIVLLGPVGRNVGAGMTGGQALIWDPTARLPGLINPALVETSRPTADELEEMRWLVETHAELTFSPLARRLVASWPATIAHTWAVTPIGAARRGESDRRRLVATS